MKNKSHGITIRMGAAHWDATVGDTQFDFRSMSKDGRRVFHREFMNAYREAQNPPKKRKAA